MRNIILLVILMLAAASLYSQPMSSTGTPFVQYLGDDFDVSITPGTVPDSGHINKFGVAGWMGTGGICNGYPVPGRRVGAMYQHYNGCNWIDAGLSEMKMFWNNPLRNYLLDGYVYDRSLLGGRLQYMWYGSWTCDNESGPT